MRDYVLRKLSLLCFYWNIDCREHRSLPESASSLDSDRGGRDANGDDEDEDNTMDFSGYLEESNSQRSKSKSRSQTVIQCNVGAHTSVSDDTHRAGAH